MTSPALAVCIIHVLTVKDRVVPHPNAQTVREAAPLILAEAEKFDIDPLLLGALCIEESRFDKHAVSPVGAQGLCQIMPGTTASRGYERLEPHQLRAPRINLHLAARHMAHLRGKCGGTPMRWLSPYGGYNCGPSQYSKKVMMTYRRLLKAAVRA
jgi:soluble lytic murein transglycosylase-like protein